MPYELCPTQTNNISTYSNMFCLYLYKFKVTHTIMVFLWAWLHPSAHALRNGSWLIDCEQCIFDVK